MATDLTEYGVAEGETRRARVCEKKRKETGRKSFCSFWSCFYPTHHFALILDPVSKSVLF